MRALGRSGRFARLPCVKRLRALWQSLWVDVDRRVRLGRLLGLVLIMVGFAVIGKAWDGAASRDFVQGQIPYLLSGGFVGIGLIATGATLLLLSAVRAERQALSEAVEDVTRLLGRNLARLQMSANGSEADSEQVVAGASVYHLPDCKVLRGKSNLATITVARAAAEGLSACRVCDPPRPEVKDEPAAVPAASGASEKPAR